MGESTGRLADVRASLKAGGYRLIDFDRRPSRGAKPQPDAVAYAANADGDLVPWVAVEVKTGLKSPALTLPRLLAARELLGTTDHYAVIDGQWYRADRSLRSFERVDGPATPPHGDYGFIQDVSLAATLMEDRLWYEEDRVRRVGSRSDVPPLADMFAETSVPGIETSSGEFVAVHPDVLWQARRQAISSFANSSRWADGLTTPDPIATAVALLTRDRLRGLVLDPFCGTGGLLWAVMDQAIGLEELTEYHGRDINYRVADLVEAIARIAPLPTTIRCDDSLRADLPDANIVVSVPPFRLRLNEPYKLMNGSETREGDAAVTDRCLRQLRPGGRAVLVLPVGITFRSALESYRRFLADEFRIGAVIGLPQGAFTRIGTRSVILVIDRSPPSETFVAQLGEDWQTQLAPDGAALTAARRHLDHLVGNE